MCVCRPRNNQFRPRGGWLYILVRIGSQTPRAGRDEVSVQSVEVAETSLALQSAEVSCAKGGQNGLCDKILRFLLNY